MTTTALFAEIAALAGDPTRVNMLHALMDGRALTASELARVANVAPQTASSHLGRMTAVGIVTVEQQGRHRYHRLASPTVAAMLESIMQVAAELAPKRLSLVVGPKDLALRAARTCYDHLAGRLGVALADALVAAGHVELTHDAGLVTARGLQFFAQFGILAEALQAGRTKHARRVLCRPCLDWSERRPHLAGALGAAICAHSFAEGWTRRSDGSRAVLVTPKGTRIFREKFGVKPALASELNGPPTTLMRPAK